MRSVWLMYHDVYEVEPAAGLPRSAAMYHVSKKDFAQHLVAIKSSGRRSLTVSEFFKSDAQDSVVITFDDGWRGSFENALPLLQELELKASFFVTRDFVGRRGFCDQAMLQQAAGTGMEIGVHGTTHRMLSSCSQEEIQWEFGTCKSFLESLLGGQAESASMPGGSWNRKIVSGAQAVGLKSLCTSRPGINKRSTSFFNLRRIPIRDVTTSLDVKRYCDYEVTRELLQWARLQLPRWLLGMKNYSLLRRWLMDEMNGANEQLFQP